MKQGAIGDMAWSRNFGVSISAIYTISGSVRILETKGAQSSTQAKSVRLLASFYQLLLLTHNDG